MRMLKVPPSKSITHRALISAALAKGRSKIFNPLDCDDTRATVDVLQALGITIEQFDDHWAVQGGAWQRPTQELFCNESATTYRFFSAIAQTLKIPCRLTGKPSLMERLVEGNISSQFLSGQLLAAPLATKETVIELATPPVSKPYVALTIDVQKKFGVEVEVENNFSRFLIKPQTYQPTALEVEGDWSSAAFLIAIGVLHKEVVLEGLNPNSLQADRAIVAIVKEMGGNIFWEGNRLIARPSSLHAIAWNFSETPDLYPVVAILAALAKGESRFSGIERLAFKESNRVAALETMLSDTRCQAPGVHSVVDSTDHRIIMAAAILKLAGAKSLEIKNKERVAKSFPNFWDLLNDI